MSIWLPMVMPYSALNELVTTRYSRIPSTPRVELLTDADVAPGRVTTLAPSNKKLLERSGAPLLLNQVPEVPGELPTVW